MLLVHIQCVKWNGNIEFVSVWIYCELIPQLSLELSVRKCNYYFSTGTSVSITKLIWFIWNVTMKLENDIPKVFYILFYTFGGLFKGMFIQKKKYITPFISCFKRKRILLYRVSKKTIPQRPVVYSIAKNKSKVIYTKIINKSVL